MPLTRDDVIEAYRVFLDREPESDAAIEEKLAGCADVGVLARQMLGCAEFANRMRALHGAEPPPLDPRCSVQMTGRPEHLEHLRAHVRETWAKLGRTEPHHSVLTGPEFLPDQMTEERTAQFYASGAVWAAEFDAVLRRNGLIAPKGAVVDFGCGLGRVGEHLSTRFDRYVGVDISPSHLALARDRFMRLGRANAEFELLPDFMAGRRRADVVYCVLVLQHNPPPVMREMLDQLLSRLNPGGLGFIQIPSAIYDYVFNVEAYLSGLGELRMEMHALPQRYVFDSIKAHGCNVIEVYSDGCAGPVGQSFRYLVQRSWDARPGAAAG